MINMQMSATSFRLAESKIGDKNFLGNGISYPPNGRTGTNVLFGTKTMVPIDGPVRENVGLLGSPAFEIPRKVDRDRDMNASFDEQTRRARLSRKNVYNFVTALIFLASHWVVVFAAFVLWPSCIRELRSFRHLRVLRSQRGAHRRQHGLLYRARAREPGLQATQAASRLDLRSVFLGARKVLEAVGFPDLDHVRRHPVPRHAASRHGHEGRCQAVRLQRSIPERSLTEVGDYTNLNEGCVLQAHSLEEGVFKSDYIRLGNRCSVGPGALVHYGVSTGDDVVLDADSFLMKGEILDSHTGWCGNPARLAARNVARAEVCVQDAADATVRNELSS